MTKINEVYHFQFNSHNDLFLPPRNNNESQEMKLMIISRKNIRNVSGERIQSILSEIYTQIYNRSSNDRTLSGILGDIPESVTLE